MKVAVIGSGIGGLVTACKLPVKRYDVPVFKKEAPYGGKISEINFIGGIVHADSGIPFCLASAKIVVNEIPVS